MNTSDRFELGRTFPNKFWNAARFAITNLEGLEAADLETFDPAAGDPEDRWILGRLAETAREATSALESFQFAELARLLRDFTWNDVCDWYLELAKANLRSDDPARLAHTRGTLVVVLDGLSRLLHPIVPFVTEQVWEALATVAPRRPTFVATSPEGRIAEAAPAACIAPWPVYPATWSDAEADEAVRQWREKITTLRNLRAERDVPASAKIAPVIVARGPARAALERGRRHLEGLTNASSVTIAESAERPRQAAVAVLADAEVILPLEGLIDPAKERARHEAGLKDLDRQVAAIRKKLDDPNFVGRAPAEVVAGQRARLTELEDQRAAVHSLLAGPP